jgi:serine/threonine protein kinase
MPLHAGDRIDRYTIVDLLGAGAMGEVYRARDTKLERLVALKVLRPEHMPAGSLGTDTTAASKRMLREARAVAALEHPNVIAIFDVGELQEPEGTTTFLAMELIKGRTLRAYVSDASVPMDRKVRWLIDVARALGAAHAAGVVHRDVKPDNVMVRDDGVVKVLDFGIAKRTRPLDQAQTETMTREGMVIGTPFYMSPEQMRGERLDGRSDQFSWGVVAYELLTGARPWSPGCDAVQLVAEILSCIPEAPMARDPSIPANASHAIERALAKVPADRFATMEELVQALEVPTSALAETRPFPSAAPPAVRSATGGSVPSLPISPVASTTEQPRALPAPRKARPTAMATALGGAAIVIGVAAALWARGGSSSRASSPPAASAAVHLGCASNAECTRLHGGKPHVCHRDDGACAPLESVDCSVRADPRALAADDTIWIGAMYPLTGDAAKNYGATELDGVDLARRDFAEILGGVTAASGAGHARPLGLVACDDAVDAERAARHLVDDVRAPAVIGFRVSEEVVRLAPSVFLPKGVLTVSAINASPMITAIPHPPGTPRLVWRTMYTTAQFARPLAAFVGDVLEPRVRKSGVSVALRVAFVRVKTISELALSDALLGTLTFNGKTALMNGTSFREIVLDDPLSSAKVDYEGAIQSLVAFAPHIVVFDSGDALMKTVLLPLEARWPSGAPRPLYADATPLPPETLAYVGTSAERRRRFFALTNVSTTAANARLVTHFNETYGAEKVTRTKVPNSSYDAFYVVAYAALSLGDAPVDGASLSAAIGRLTPPGKPIDVGPLGILEGFGALRGGERIDLNGSIGGLDFDPKTGEAPIDMAVLCIGVDHLGRANEAIESGLVYETRVGKLTGAMSCP